MEKAGGVDWLVSVAARLIRRFPNQITLVAPLVASFALQFGPAEKFAVYFLAFCSFVGLSKEPPFKTIAAMMIGFALYWLIQRFVFKSEDVREVEGIFKKIIPRWQKGKA
jgi:TctA family transporter